ncbi:MAG TPA: D-Ala-D-Ala carboxypeptidase family metallohydrolase [Actinomycetota bacterium]|nr:D-Ala-D-Ala carboxypeptidase family metallohydrolase [Actinomycetota bacterium]
MTASRRLRPLAGVLAAGVLANVALAAPAAAYDWPRRLRPGAHGAHVRVLQVRVAGWSTLSRPAQFVIDGDYGAATAAAVRAFETFYGIPHPNGVAGPKTFAKLNSLQDADGSTKHFDFSEFVQRSSSSCSARANAYAGTFGGGMVPEKTVRRNVRHLMWRLEAVRAKGGSHPIGINSGYRSVAYNDCIGGASVSQHMYGTAADNRMAEVSNRRARDLAKLSQVHGIGCYSSQTHNHFDLRMDNAALSYARAWWWPDRDSRGRDLDDNGVPCWGEVARTAAPMATVLEGVAEALPGAGSLVPSAAEIELFERAGEPADLEGAD